jgi:UDP:flavonoid glycosyltransferase YjiC (YdhE family)
VTFILDQPFWGKRIYELGIGPRHIPVQELTVPRLVEGIKYLQRPEVKAAAVELGKKVAAQNGALTAADSILAHIPDGFVAGQPCMPWKHAIDPTSPSYGQWAC